MVKSLEIVGKRSCGFDSVVARLAVVCCHFVRIVATGCHSSPTPFLEKCFFHGHKCVRQTLLPDILKSQPFVAMSPKILFSELLSVFFGVSREVVVSVAICFVELFEIEPEYATAFAADDEK